MGIESTKCMQTKEFCGAPWPSKLFYERGCSMKGDVKRNIAPSTGSCPGFGVGIQPVQLEVAPGLAYALGSSHKAMHPRGFIY